MSRTAWFPCFLTAFVALISFACGGKSSSKSNIGGAGDDDDDGASHGSIGGASGGTQSRDCRSFEDDPGWSMIVVIANERREPIHVGQEEMNCTGQTPLFQVENEDGSALEELGECRSPCKSLIAGEPFGCPPVCLLPNTLTLAPGARATIPWDGLYLNHETIPSTCLKSGGACDRGVAVQPGTYEFRAQAGTTRDCSPLPLGECGECIPDSNGGCNTFGAVIGGTRLSVELEVRLDGGYGVGESRGDGPPLPIELTFQD